MWHAPLFLLPDIQAESFTLHPLVLQYRGICRSHGLCSRQWVGRVILEQETAHYCHWHKCRT